MVKEFLDEHGVRYESVNLADQRERWVAAGSPTAPSLEVGGVAHPVFHPRHAARLLGIAVNPRLDPIRLASDLVGVLDAWVECLRSTSWPLLLQPTESRGRTPRELAVNVFKFAELLPSAWTTCRWNGALERGLEIWLDEERAAEAALTDRATLVAYAEAIRDMLTAFFQETDDELELADSLIVQTACGDLSFTDLLDGQRVHAGQHYRQVTTFLESIGAPVPAVALDAIRELPLPRRIY